MHTPSPCVSDCTIGPDGLCRGCYRTLKEIAQWGTMTNEERNSVLDRIFDSCYDQDSDQTKENL